MKRSLNFKVEAHASAHVKNFRAEAYATARIKILKLKAHCGGGCVKFKNRSAGARNFRIDPFAKLCVIDLFAKPRP
mgnify:CR=1 FL=1